MPAASEVGEEVKVGGKRYCPFMYAFFTDVFIKPRINRNIDVLFKKSLWAGKKVFYCLDL